MNSCAVEITTSAFVVVNFTISCMNGYPERAVREKMGGFWEGNKGEKMYHSLPRHGVVFRGRIVAPLRTRTK